VDVNVPSVCSLDQVFSVVERHWNKDYKDKYEESLSREASPNDTEGKPNSFLEDFGTMFKVNTSNTSSKATLETFASEFQRWIVHPIVPMSVSSHEVCKWWSLTVTYPQVKMMAQDYLAVTATSVPSEYIFSRVGDIIKKKRARLGDDAVEALTALQSWLKFLS